MKSILLALLCFPVLLVAQSLSKNSVNQYETGSKAKLIINTRFANVYFTGSDSKTVKVETQYRIKSKSNKKATEQLDRAKVKVEAKGNTVQIGYDFQSGEGHDNIVIETEIRISGPLNTDMDANCTYGNLIINRTQGICKLGVRYGLLQVSDLNSESNDIDIAYSTNSSLKSITKTICDVDYSTVIIQSVGKLDLTSKYSVIELSKVDELKLHSEGDKLAMDVMSTISGSSKLSSITIKGLSKAFDMDSEYGNINISQVDSKFSSIRINASYAQLGLGFNKNTGFGFNIKSVYGSINLPRSGATIQSDIEARNTRTLNGEMNGGGKANVIISTNYGNTDIHITN